MAECADYNRRMPRPRRIRSRAPVARRALARRRARRMRGFTLIEIMVVIVILGMLAALVVPRVLERPDEARAVAAKSDIAAIVAALKLYRLDNQRYPTTEQGLPRWSRKPETRRCRPTGSPAATSSACPKDPWGRPYQYLNPGVQGRDRRLQLRRGRPARRRRHRRRHRLVGPLSVAVRRARSAAARRRGFTLVEILVVLVDHRARRAGSPSSHSAPTSAATPSARRGVSRARWSTRRRARSGSTRRSACAPTAAPAASGAAATRRALDAARPTTTCSRRARCLRAAVAAASRYAGQPRRVRRDRSRFARSAATNRSHSSLRRRPQSRPIVVARRSAEPRRRSCAPSRRPRGFTLVEILVALAIVAVALAAGMRALAQASRRRDARSRRARWRCGSRRTASRRRSSPTPWPAPGTRDGEAIAGGGALRVARQRRARTPNPSFRRIEIVGGRSRRARLRARAPRSATSGSRNGHERARGTRAASR